jgi:intracellular multiplication protein IcmK
VSLAPGATPPVIRLAAGFVSSLVFLDSTGEPWPIEAYDVGNPAAFNVQWNKKDNTMMIQAISQYKYGNLAVRLRGAKTPVMLTLIPGQKTVDYRVDLRVQGFGPNASIPTTTNLPAKASSELINVLDGVPPAGSKSLTVKGGNAQAWLQGSRLFLRTRLTVISPSWESMMNSADGMHAYQMSKVPLVLVSQQGKIIQLHLEGL